MILDAVALTNLEILANNFDRTEKGSLWAFMNRCKTAFGARLLKEWVCHPLLRVGDINDRAAAVEELLNALQTEAETARKELKAVPDLERLLARIHSNGLKRKSGGDCDHPDSRAIMYEGPIYNSRKIRDFSDVLTGFEVVSKVAAIFEDSTVTSTLLKKAVKSPSSTVSGAGFSDGGKFPTEEMTKLLTYFRSIFDERQAKKDGAIRPRAGVDPEYDQAKADIARLEGALEEYLREMKRKTGINDLKYWGTNKDRYQIEVPINSIGKVPKDWTSKSQKKTHRRYWTPLIEETFAEMVEAEERMATAQKDTLRRIFEK
jgi:DNA mismatch repair protein MSH6